VEWWGRREEGGGRGGRDGGCSTIGGERVGEKLWVLKVGVDRKGRGWVYHLLEFIRRGEREGFACVKEEQQEKCKLSREIMEMTV